MLFKARFKDGSTLAQTPEDVSTTTLGKNAFFDVLQRIDEVKRFHLIGEHTYTVDLTTGHFEVDGVPFHTGDPTVSLPAGIERRLIYFRRVSHHYGANLQHLATGYEYFIGWQATHDGKNFKATISVR